MSDLGRYRPGSAVTLLLGRNGGVAAVADANAIPGEKLGVVLSVDSASYPDGNGGSYAAQTITLLSTDGRTYQYPVQGTCRAGSVVRVSSRGGEITLQSLSSTPLSGKVSRDGGTLGKYPFAQGAEILDVSGSRGAVVTPGRLAGLTLSGRDVRYYTLNPQGELETLILNDVTGDACQYGMLVHLEAAGEGGAKYFSYTYDVDGVTYTLPGTTTRFPVESGAIRVSGSLSSPDRLYALTAVQGGRIAGGQLLAGNQKYTLSDKVTVYERRNGQFYLSTLARAEAAGGGLTAWYDKDESLGGRVRVIVIPSQQS